MVILCCSYVVHMYGCLSSAPSLHLVSREEREHEAQLFLRGEHSSSWQAFAIMSHGPSLGYLATATARETRYHVLKSSGWLWGRKEVNSLGIWSFLAEPWKFKTLGCTDRALWAVSAPCKDFSQFLHPDSTRAFEDFTSPLVCLTLCSWQVGKSRTLGSPGTSGLKQPNWGGALPAGNSGGPERFLEGSLTMHFRTLWSRNMHSQDLLRHKD